MSRLCLKVQVSLAVLASVASSSPAQAHGETGLPQGLQLVFSPEDQRPHAIIAAGGGLLIRDDDGTWSYLCAGAIGVLSRALDGGRIYQDLDGDLLLGTFSGLLRSGRDRCGWEPVSPFMMRAVVVLSSGPQGTVYAITGTGDGEDAAFRSTDDGATWQSMFGLEEGVWYSELLHAPSNPERLFLAGTRFDSDTMRSLPFVARSDDGGDTVEIIELDETWQGFRILLVDPRDQEAILAAYIEELPEHTLTELVGGLAQVVRSTDGGGFWEPVAQVAELLAVAQTPDGSKVWISDGAGTLLLSQDRGRTFNAINDDVVLSCLDHKGGALWACADLLAEGFSVGVSNDDGASFEATVGFDEVLAPRECSDGPDVAGVCEAQWQTWKFWFSSESGTDEGTDEAGVPDLQSPDGGGGGMAPEVDTVRNAAEGANAGASDGGCRVSLLPRSSHPWLVIAVGTLLSLRRRRFRPS